MRSLRDIGKRVDAMIGRSALFGRAAILTLSACAGALGFLSGIRAGSSTYDPHRYAVGASVLLAAACIAIVVLDRRRRAQKDEFDAQAKRLEAIADENWELREAQERMKSLLDSHGDIIVRRNSDGRVTFANDAFRRLAAPDGGRLAIIEEGPVSVMPDGTRTHDQKLSCRDGERWIAWRDVLVRTDDGTETQSVGRDISARVRVELALAGARDAAEDASRAKSRFLAMVSHEIRTPLNGILGMTDLLLDTRLSPEQKTYAGAAKTSGEALLSLIEEILDFSKIEAGKIDIDATPLSLIPLVEDVVELLAPRAHAKGIEIASFVDPRLPGRIVADAARLRQVLLNLAGNAVKFTETGGVAVIVEPGATTQHIDIVIRDTGIGLSAVDQARVFEEFEQADNGAARRFGGTGLGLAITRRIVARMGGRINVSSAPGAGATFTVSLPLARADDDLQRTTTPDLAGAGILIAAPTTIEAALLARRLRHWGADCSVVSDVQTATALMGQRRWDVLLADHVLAPDILVTASAAIRRIAMIAPAQRDTLASLKHAGFDGYLVKPVRAASLAAQLGVDVSAGETGETAPEQTIAPAASAGLSILVAEDNEINALLARALLTRMGHRPTIVADGDAAVESWHAARQAGAPYGLVLMDLHMPGCDGLAATRRIRAAESAGDTRTPVVALTANAFDEDRTACLAAGMDGFLVKPLDRERLAETIASTGGRTPTLAA